MIDEMPFSCQFVMIDILILVGVTSSIHIGISISGEVVEGVVEPTSKYSITKSSTVLVISLIVKGESEEM